MFLTAVSLTEWRAENGVTADYVSGDNVVLKYGNGNMRITYAHTVDITTATSIGNVYRGTLPITHIVSFATTLMSLSLSNTDAADIDGWAGEASAVTATGFNFNIFGAGATTRTKPSYVAEGKY